MNEKYNEYNLLDCFRPGNKNDVIEGKKMPEYEGVLAELGFVMLRAVSDFLSQCETVLNLEDRDATDIFFDFYDYWTEEKRRHEQINKYFVAMGENEREEPLPNRMIDALMSYFDGERFYNGNNSFQGLREDKITPEWRKMKYADMAGKYIGGND